MILFSLSERNPNRTKEPRTEAFVKYEITPDGLREVFLGSVYSKIIPNW